MESMNIRVIAGRKFVSDSETDRTQSVLVSEEFVNQFGWKDNPIGKRIVWKDTVQLYVVGIVKNIYARTLWQPLRPMMIRSITPEQYTQLVVLATPGKMTNINEFMKEKWREVFPNLIYEGQFINYEIKNAEDTNRNVIVICGFLGIFAGLMSAIGLFTLVSLTITKRIKEIGIRKVLGASVRSIVTLISFDFMIILIFASLLGGAVGFAMVDLSMDAAWEYYEKVSIITLSTSVTIMILLAVLTVGFKTINAAQMNPVKNLRAE